MRAPGRPLILLVEDSEAVRDAFTILLEESGYRVTGAADGARALESAAENPPDLILLDLGLPGLDGVEVIGALRTRPSTAATPIVVLTGRDDPATRQACARAGCDDFLIKPFPVQHLLRAVAAHLPSAGQKSGS